MLKKKKKVKGKRFSGSLDDRPSLRRTVLLGPTFLDYWDFIIFYYFVVVAICDFVMLLFSKLQCTTHTHAKWDQNM